MRGASYPPQNEIQTNPQTNPQSQNTPTHYQTPSTDDDVPMFLEQLSFADRTALQQLTLRLPSEFGAFREEAVELERVFLQLIAERLQNQFNHFLRQIPHETLEQKRNLAKFANAELQRLGLAIRCPKTGRSALLVADGYGDEVGGRFTLKIQLECGRETHRTHSYELPVLQLMADDRTRSTRKERFQWAQRVIAEHQRRKNR
jgi:hypothetical protein